MNGRHNLTSLLYMRQAGLVSANFNFAGKCKRFLLLSEFFRRRPEQEPGRRYSVVIGFLQNGGNWPMLATLWYTSLNWIHVYIHLVLDDFLYLRKTLMVVPLGQFEDYPVHIDLLQFQEEILDYAVLQITNVPENNASGIQYCLLSLPDISDCVRCRSNGVLRNFHLHKFCVKLPSIFVESRQQLKPHIFRWKSSSDKLIPFYDIVFTVLDTNEPYCLDIVSLYVTTSTELCGLIEDMSLEMASSNAEALPHVIVQSSTHAFVQGQHVATSGLPRSCRHSRELLLPSVFTAETSANYKLVPICFECMTGKLQQSDVEFDEFAVLLVRQARLEILPEKNFHLLSDFGLAADGDCMLITCLSRCMSTSFAFVFNLLSFQVDYKIERIERNLSICSPAFENEAYVYNVSNDAVFHRKSRKRIEDATGCFTIINDGNVASPSSSYGSEPPSVSPSFSTATFSSNSD